MSNQEKKSKNFAWALKSINAYSQSNLDSSQVVERMTPNIYQIANEEQTEPDQETGNPKVGDPIKGRNKR